MSFALNGRMGEDFTIRPVARADVPALLALYKHLNPGDPELDIASAGDSLERIPDYPGSAVLVGLRDDVIVTSCTLIVIPNLTRGGAPYGLIENVVTDPGHRKRGYGKAVLTAAFEIAWQNDCYKVMLLTGSKRPSTLKFYEDVGFEQKKTGFQIRHPSMQIN